MPRSPRTPRVRRRDFTDHWVLSERARRWARVVRRLLEAPSRLPAPAFALLLGVLALGSAGGRWEWWLGLWAFMAGDWALVAQLPRRGKSYGPVQPVTLCLALPRAAFALLPLPWPVALGVQALGTALAWYALWVEPHRIELRREALRSFRLRPGRPLRLLHLGDLHVERVTERERRLVALVESLGPDLVLCSGDHLNTSYVGDPGAREACRWVLERLAAPLGVFVVAGSPPSDPEEAMAAVVAGLPVRWLRDERVTLERDGQAFDLVGLDCTHRPFLDRPRLEAALVGGPRRFTILLYHTPDLAPDAAELPVDLMLCGHTHGGQVRLPGFGALFTSSLYGKALEYGRYQLEGLTLYVTAGLGMEGSAAPRVRLFCPPEVVLWEIHGRSDSP